MVFNKKVSRNKVFNTGKMQNICMNGMNARESENLDLVRSSLKSMFVFLYTKYYVYKLCVSCKRVYSLI